MGFKLSKGLKLGMRRISLSFMHSSAGTKKFVSLSSGNQKRWSSFDRVASRSKFRNQ